MRTLRQEGLNSLSKVTELQRGKVRIQTQEIWHLSLPVLLVSSPALLVSGFVQGLRIEHERRVYNSSYFFSTPHHNYSFSALNPSWTCDREAQNWVLISMEMTT